MSRKVKETDLDRFDGEEEVKEPQPGDKGVEGTVAPLASNKTPRLSKIKDELQAEADALQKELAPHRELHDKHVNDPAYLKARAKIKEINAKLFPIMNELAALARTGGAKASLKAEGGEYSKTEG